MKTFLYVLFFLILQGCSKDETTQTSCDLTSLESEIVTKLENATTDTDFSFYVEREDGKSFNYNKGSSTLDTVYQSASTSKWVSAALVLWVLEKTSGFDLSDKPSDHYAWNMPTNDPLYNTTLAQLLSFTSGLQGEPNCLKLGIPSKSFDNCINDTSGSIVSENKEKTYSPGQEFYYSSSHLQIAGAMAIAAGSYTDWDSLFTTFKLSTGLFPNSSYSLPSSSNPRLAGGMTWTGSDYVGFLRSLYRNELFSSNLKDQMFQDHIKDLSIEYSPAFTGVGEQWHYGLGVWLECHSSTFNCSSIEYYSSPGAYGAYPFMNLNKKIFGIIARQGSLGTYPNGINLYRSVKTTVEKWATCK